MHVLCRMAIWWISWIRGYLPYESTWSTANKKRLPHVNSVCSGLTLGMLFADGKQILACKTHNCVFSHHRATSWIMYKPSSDNLRVDLHASIHAFAINRQWENSLELYNQNRSLSIPLVIIKSLKQYIYRRGFRCHRSIYCVVQSCYMRLLDVREALTMSG